MMYVLILKTIYGMIESDLLWYELLSTTLSYLVFKLNPYQFFIENEIINKNKCTIGLFIDDKKVSHVYDIFNSTIMDNVEED